MSSDKVYFIKIKTQDGEVFTSTPIKGADEYLKTITDNYGNLDNISFTIIQNGSEIKIVIPKGILNTSILTIEEVIDSE